MALIKCSECKQDVSGKATLCPHCGNPVATQPSQPIETVTRIDTVERTSKKWKAIFAISIFICVIAAFTFMAGASNKNSNTIGLSIFIFIIGFIGVMIAKFGMWWKHG